MLYKLLTIQPSLIINGDVTRIDLDFLVTQGIRGMILDLDNTIIPPKTCRLDPPIAEWLDAARAREIKLIVLSNNKRLAYCQEAEAVLSIPVIHYAAKPALKKFREALSILELVPGEVVVIGDRPLTDILGGQRLGAYTVLVDPLTKLSEPWYVQRLRALERSFVKHGLTEGCVSQGA
ncbi:MAG: YqeG family HAD IIIA-type phosphatase [Candidatus Melainabacteria bacterium]